MRIITLFRQFTQSVLLLAVSAKIIWKSLRGALNVMKLFGMMQGKLEGSLSKYYLSGNGDTDQCVSATTDGYSQRKLRKVLNKAGEGNKNRFLLSSLLSFQT